jgi:very-short-patch-repair endonuclease
MKAQSAAQSVQLARQLGFARAMRRAPTASERALWAALSGSKLGVGFRRQQVVAGCIVDFLAPSRKLVVEVHGATTARRRNTARMRAGTVGWSARGFGCCGCRRS